MNENEILEAMKTIKNHCSSISDCKDCTIQENCESYFRPYISPEEWDIKE